MTARGRLHLAVLAMLAAACGGPEAARPDAARDAPPPPAAEVAAGPVVATVDGEPITLAEVRATVEDTGLTPLEALHRLEEERVLHHHALASAQGTAEVDHAARRAAVQALLRARVEDAVGPSSVTDAEVMALYDSMRASFAQPERRASVHVLARVPRDADEATLAAAERYARRVIEELSAEADPASAAERYRAEDTPDRVFRVVVEQLPPASRRAPLEAPYLEALFSRDTPGVVAEPARSTNGFHAVVVASIEPPFRVPVDEAEPMLRRQLLAEHRAAALDALDAELRATRPVTIDERAVRLAVEADPLADEPPLGTRAP